MKPCPHCSTPLHNESVFCQHCRRDLATAENTLVARDDHRRVTVVNIDMPFGSMVGFMVKWAIATIPAMLLLALVALGIAGFFVAIGAAGLF